MYEAFDFEILLYDAYQQIIFYGKSDASVMIGVLKSLRFSKFKATSENIRTINKYATNLFEKLIKNSFDPLEYTKIKNEFNDLIEL